MKYYKCASSNKRWNFHEAYKEYERITGWTKGKRPSDCPAFSEMFRLVVI